MVSYSQNIKVCWRLRMPGVLIGTASFMLWYWGQDPVVTYSTCSFRDAVQMEMTCPVSRYYA